jgi:hypothetical protein
VLNRFIEGKRDELQGPRATRPYLASECSSVPEAEKWRMEIVREVGKKVSMIQNGAPLRTSRSMIPARAHAHSLWLAHARYPATRGRLRQRASPSTSSAT